MDTPQQRALGLHKGAKRTEGEPSLVLEFLYSITDCTHFKLATQGSKHTCKQHIRQHKGREEALGTHGT